MDNFEWTKIAGAVLCALLVIFGPKAVIELNTHAPAKPGYTLPAAAAAAPDHGGDAKAAEAGAAPAGGESVIALLAKANAENGKAVFSKCKTCHVAEKGKPSTVGPNLWGVVNRPKAHLEGYKYSEGMKAKGGEWTFENISTFLHDPKAYVPGTKMTFAGIPKASDEADLIAYLATLSDTPVPLPK